MSGVSIFALAEVAAGERDENVCERGMTRGEAGQAEAAGLQQRQNGGQGDVRLLDGEAVAFGVAANRTDGGQPTKIRFVERRRAGGELKIDDVFAAELMNQLGWRAESDD